MYPGRPVTTTNPSPYPLTLTPTLGLEPERDFPRLPLEREEELERPRDLGVPRTPFVCRSALHGM